MIDLRDEMKFRESLLEKINSAISEGAEEIAYKKWLEEQRNTVFNLIVKNAEEGKPLLEGFSVWRGSKDPDVDNGTFSKEWRHGTPSGHEALGYASIANTNVGFNPKSVTGFGVVARYSLNSEMRFYPNFGLEYEHEGKSVKEIELELTSIVEKVISLKGNHYTSRDYFHPHVKELNDYISKNLYETRIPASVVPEEKWLVAPNEKNFVTKANDISEFRLIPLNDNSPKILHEVAIDLVIARGLELGAYDIREGMKLLNENLRKVDYIKDNFGEAVAKEAENRTEKLIEICKKSIEPILISNNEHPKTIEEAISIRLKNQDGIDLKRINNTESPNFNVGSKVNIVIKDLAEKSMEANWIYNRKLSVEKESLIKEICVDLLKYSSGIEQNKELIESLDKRFSEVKDRYDSKKKELKIWKNKIEDSQSKIDEANSNFFKKLYYSTLGKKQLNIWKERRDYLGKETNKILKEYKEVKIEIEEIPKKKENVTEARSEQIKKYEKLLFDLKKDEDLYRDLFPYKQPFPNSSEINLALKSVEQRLSTNQEILSNLLSAKNQLDLILDRVDRGFGLVDAWEDVNTKIQNQTNLSEKKDVVDNQSTKKIMEIRKKGVDIEMEQSQKLKFG